MNEPSWVKLDRVLAIHDVQLARHGGTAGIRDQKLLESIVARPEHMYQTEPQSSLSQLAAAYSIGLAAERPFLDGNKRTALLTAALFLAKNGFFLNVQQPEAVIATIRLASGDWKEAPFGAWLQQHSVQI